MYITKISPKYTKISTKASPYRNLLPSIGGGCKDYQGIKTGGWKFSGSGCVSQQNYRCCRNVQREVLKFAISIVQCVVAVATQLACSIWIMHYIIYIIITILYNNDNNNDICFHNVDPVTILHSPSFLLYCPARFGLFLNPAPLEVNGACPGADAPLFGAVAAVIDTGGCFSLRQSRVTFGEAIAIP